MITEAKKVGDSHNEDRHGDSLYIYLLQQDFVIRLH